MSLQAMRSAALVSRRLALQRPAFAVLSQGRFYSSQPEPKARAQSIIDALPGNSPLTKSGLLATGVAGAVYAVANSLYVVNAETVLLTVFAAFIGIASKTIAPAYKEWAEGHVNHIKNTLNKAREEHVVAVQDRIDSVNKLGDVVGTTQSLFAVSKQTVELEAKAFELKQKVELAAQAKEVLDSWVRYESQVRQREQSELISSVIAKIEKNVSSDKFQADALKQAVADIEAVFKKN